MAERLGEILVKSGRITEQQLAKAVQEQDGSELFLGDIVVALGYASQDDIARALAIQLGIPFMELGDDFRLESEEIELIPETVARRFCLLPLRKHDGPTMTVVMRDPLDLEALNSVQSLTRLEVHKAISTEERIRAVIDKFYSEEAHIERNLRDIADGEATEDPELSASGAEADRLRVIANDAPVVRYVNLLLMQAVRDRASDIHFEPGEKKVTVRLRIDGVLREVTPPPKTLYQAIVTRVKILANMDIAERRLPLDGRLRFTVQDRSIDVRVSSLPEVHGEKLVLRILDRSAALVDLGHSGMAQEQVERFKQILQAPHGIILLTGPTGSGKTTTLYGALSYIRDPGLNIQTVEDPVEYEIDGVNQMQIRPGIGLDFADALRHILRQDPDVIMIGEIRDEETARIAMRASLTGHLVLSTLHTNDAPSALSRLRDIGIEPYLIASSLVLVVAQRLVRRLCEACKQVRQPPGELLRLVTSVYPDAPGWTYYAGAGCPKCGQTGYFGRTAVVEFLEVTEPVRELVRTGRDEGELRRKAAELNMRTLQEDGMLKVRNGVSSLEEVLSICPVLPVS